MRIFIILILSQTLLFGGSKSNFSDWNTLLKQNVDNNGLVNYSALKGNALFNKSIKKFESTNISSMKKYEKLSFLINAYNAFVIKNVLDHNGMKSPLDDKEFFKEKKFILAGKKVSLDEIEHNYVLKIEPALSHFGLVCGAISCPKLIPFAYNADNVLKQLKINAAEFVNNKSKNHLDKKHEILYLSQIFNWFKNYFVQNNSSVRKFVLKYLNNNDKKFMQSNNILIKFMKYDWKLNAQTEGL